MKAIILSTIITTLVACGTEPVSSNTQAIDLGSASSGTSAQQMTGTFNIEVNGYGRATLSFKLSPLGGQSASFVSTVIKTSAELRGKVSGDQLTLTKNGNVYSDRNVSVSIDQNLGTSRVVKYFNQQVSQSAEETPKNTTKAVNSGNLAQSSDVDHSAIDQLYKEKCPEIFESQKNSNCSFTHEGKNYGGSSSTPISDSEWEKVKQEPWYKGSNLERDENNGRFDKPHDPNYKR